MKTILNVSLALTSAQDFALTITLVVFVLLTALLAAFIIMLFAWKRFRDFFFADKKKKEKQPRTKTAKSQKAEPNRAQNRVQAPANSSAKIAKTRASSEYRIDDCCDGVPTVPLNGTTELHVPPAATAPKAVKRTDTTLDKIPTVVIGAPKTTDRTAAASSKKQAGATSKTSPVKNPAANRASGKTPTSETTAKKGGK